MTELLNGRIVDQFRPIRRVEMNQFLRLILNKAKAGEAFDVGAVIARLTNNIISRMASTQRCSCTDDKADKIRKLVGELTDLVGKCSLLDLIWFVKNLDLQGLKNARDRYDNMMEEIIKEHEEVKRKSKESGDGNRPTKDIHESLLDIYEEESSEIKLTRENIKALIMVKENLSCTHMNYRLGCHLV